MTYYTQAEQKERLTKRVILECQRRNVLYCSLFPAPDELKNPDILAEKAQRLILQLEIWAKDPLAWISDMAWAPDPVNNFGSKAIPEHLAPKGMVPVIPFPVQKNLVLMLEEALETDGPCDVAFDKCRQVAATTIVEWWMLRCWLFRPSTTFLMGSYADDVIDMGGKGQRDAVSLFGRQRLFIDAMMWCIPVLKFNQHQAPSGKVTRNNAYKFRQWAQNATGMTEAEDISFKLTRPKWVVGGTEIYRGAEGNWMRGALPSDKFGRSYTPTVIFMDELPHYTKHLGAGKDREAWAATVNNSKMRVVTGTPPRGGGMGSLMPELLRQDEGPVFRKMSIDWVDIPPYFAGASWKCPRCKLLTDIPMKEKPPAEGAKKKCDHCGAGHIVTRFDCTSPWFENACARAQHDPVTIAAEIQRDWGGTIGDRLFDGWQSSVGVRPFQMPRRAVFVEGFDPGFSASNPASWVLACLDCEEMTIQIVGYWMAAGTLAEWWVPFLKRWSPRQLDRMRVVYGKKAGQTFSEAFGYDRASLEMLERVSNFWRGDVFGDKYGSHRHMTESAYERLADYGVHVDQEYTTDRQALVRAGKEWAHRMVIDASIAGVQPPSPFGAPYPSIQAVFESAKPKPYGGQGEYKEDVDKQDPPHVSHACDAWFYLCRAFDPAVHAAFSPGGGWGVDSADDGPRVMIYGGDRSL